MGISGDVERGGREKNEVRLEAEATVENVGQMGYHKRCKDDIV